MEFALTKPDRKFVEYSKNSALKRDCTTKTKLIDAIIDEWYRDKEITQNCKKLVESMPKRGME